MAELLNVRFAPLHNGVGEALAESPETANTSVCVPPAAALPEKVPASVEMLDVVNALTPSELVVVGALALSTVIKK